MSSRPGPKMVDPSHEKVLQFVREHRRPFVTSREVAERFDSVSRRTINNRLNTLHDREQLGKRKIGARSIVWYPQSTVDSASRPASESQ